MLSSVPGRSGTGIVAAEDGESREGHDETILLGKAHGWEAPASGSDASTIWTPQPSPFRYAAGFFEQLRDRPVPLDMNILKSLRSPFQMD